MPRRSRGGAILGDPLGGVNRNVGSHTLCYTAAVRRWLGIALLAAAAACSPGSEVSAEDRRAIEALLTEYTRQMAAAYQSGDASLVAPVATEREQNRLGAAIAELEGEGRGLRPQLERLSIQAIEAASRTTFTVDTLEVWDLRVVALGTEQPVSESLDQENRLTYTVIRERGQWRILSRLLRASTEPS